MAYCENEQCEYNEDGCCEYEGTLSIDRAGFCKRFRYKEVEVEGQTPIHEKEMRELLR